jgi:D-arabinose 1-dehydrogenase-like Zn-dependent alcohol dehydrogenase
MQAAVLKAPQSQVAIETRDTPSPGRGDILMRVRACGVCAGDLLLQQGAFPGARYPIVPGHEIAGVVEAIGEDVTWPQPGDRVGLSGLFSSCGYCAPCCAGKERYCTASTFTGFTHDGGYQEYMVASATYVAPLPAALDFAEAAPLMCAGVTVYSALRHAGFTPGAKVAVIGLGGLGHLGVCYAKAMGGRVAVLSTRAEKADEARRLGAERFIHLTTEAPNEALRAWDGGANIILATAPVAASMTAAFPGLAIDGTMVVLGTPAQGPTLNPMDLILGRRRVMGSLAGSRSDLRETLSLAATHDVRPQITRMPLAEADKALSLLQAGRVHGRLVLVMD